MRNIDKTGHPEPGFSAHDELICFELISGVGVDLNFERPAPEDVHRLAIQDQRGALWDAGGGRNPELEQVVDSAELTGVRSDPARTGPATT
jgi:hypothetical protein